MAASDDVPATKDPLKASCPWCSTKARRVEQPWLNGKWVTAEFECGNCFRRWTSSMLRIHWPDGVPIASRRGQ